MFLRYHFSVILGSLLLTVSLGIDYNAAMYATRNAGPAVTDIFLDNAPVMDVDIIFIDGALLFALIVAAVLLYYPKFIPFVLKSAALFIIVRSFSITLTHIGLSPQQLPVDINRFARVFLFGGDLFFSGHTGLPYLMALIFWNHKFLRNFFIFASVVAGFSVLLGHLHYSIDVFAAFFITYGIFHIAIRLFKKDYEYLLKF